MKSAIGFAVIFALIVAGFWLMWQWGFCRFYIEPNEMAVITAKVGDDLPPGQILGKKGQANCPQYSPHARNPMFGGKMENTWTPVAAEGNCLEWSSCPVQRTGGMSTIRCPCSSLTSSQASDRLPPITPA